MKFLMLMTDVKNRIHEICKQLALVDDAPIAKANGGQRNQVWFCGNHVFRMNFQTDSQTLHNEAMLLNQIPDSIPHPRVIAAGHDQYGEWQVQNKLEGNPLSQVWADMPIPLRIQAIRQLAQILQGIHELEPAKLQIPFHRYHDLHSELPNRIMAFATQSKTLPYVDSKLMDQVITTTKSMAKEISSSGKWGIVHNDLHFDNILWDGQNITSLLDYERACYGPLDLELDLLLRFCAYPALFVHEEYEPYVHPEDYKSVPNWLYESYPEILMVDKLAERLSLYSLNYDLQMLQKFPPNEEVNPCEDDHLINRIRAIVEQRSYLSTLTTL